MTRFEYNGRYLVTRVVDPLQAAEGGLGIRIGYDDRGNRIRVTDTEGGVTRYSYDADDRLVAVARDSDEHGPVRTEHDQSLFYAQGVVATTDPLGKTTRKHYDPWGRVRRVIDPAGYEERTWYDGEGNIVAQRDGRGEYRHWERNQRGLVEAYHDALAQGGQATFEYSYDANNRLTESYRLDSAGTGYVETEYQYDAEGRLEVVVEAKGTPVERSRSVEHDAMGNPVEVRDFLGQPTYYEYNAVYRPVREVDAHGQAIEYDYSATGKLDEVRDLRAASARVTRYDRDVLDRVVRVEDPLYAQDSQHYIGYSYDSLGNITAERDARGIETQYEYDSLYRRVRTVRGGQQVERLEYDAVGNVTRRHDAEDRLVVEYEKKRVSGTGT